MKSTKLSLLKRGGNIAVALLLVFVISLQTVVATPINDQESNMEKQTENQITPPKSKEPENINQDNQNNPPNIEKKPNKAENQDENYDETKKIENDIPKKPPGILIKKIYTNSIKIEVKIPGDSKVKKLTLEYITKLGVKKNKTIQITNKSLQKYTLNSLKPYCGYKIRGRFLSVTNKKGRWSSRKSFTTKKVSKNQLLNYLYKIPKRYGPNTYNSNYPLKKTKSGRNLISYLNYLKKRYKVYFVMIDVNTGECLYRAPHKVMYSASCLKGPYVAAINKFSPKKARKSKYRHLMKNTIIPSSNEDYAALRRIFGHKIMKKLMNYVRVFSFKYYKKYTYLPVKDLAKLWIGTYWYFYNSTNSNSKMTRKYYTHGYQSFIYQAMKKKYTVNTKAGWYPGGGYNVQNDAGIVLSRINKKSHPYILVVNTSACSKFGKLRTLVKKIDAVHTDMLKKR